NMGIRLFEVRGGVAHIVTTIGGQAVGGECSLDSGHIGLAAGADGSVFALLQLNYGRGNSDDEVVEFAAGGAGACPVPDGEVGIMAADGEALAKGKNGEYLAYKGAPVRFDASGIDRKGEAPFEYAWNFTGATTGGPAGDGFTFVSKIES